MAFDLLGLNDPTVQEGRALAIVEDHLRDDEFIRKAFERRLFVAGSQVIRTAPIKPGGTLTFWELLDIAHVQAALIRRGVLLRGAITLGDVSTGADFATGRGLFEAERLRDEVAGVPRVIVDPRLILETEQNPALRAKHHTVLMELGYVRDLLREDADGLWFIDYLKVVVSEADEPPDSIWFLDEHRRQVERRLESSPALDGSSRSWTWLRSYHNNVIEACVERGWIEEADRSSLHVKARSPLLYAFPPSTKEAV
jgi:hypothetical protein